jgi:C4-dicarboxylate-specific signal transduction histidine kinase
MLKTGLESRCQLLSAYGILDTPPEKTYDDLVGFLATYCAVPIALVSLVDDDRQWFKARFGLDAPETPRGISFCTHAIQSDDLFIVEDTVRDPRFHDNPLVTGEPKVGFYAGAPLVGEDGFRLGTVCLIDHQPRQLSKDQLRLLKVVAGHVSSLLEVRRSHILLQAAADEAARREAQARGLIDRQDALLRGIQGGLLVEDPARHVILMNVAFGEMFGLRNPSGFYGRSSAEVFATIGGLFKSPVPAAESDAQGSRREDFELNDGRFVERECTRILSDDPASQGTLSIFRDISERRRMEIFIENQRVQLAETLKLRALGEMAGGISHEINNPLTIIQGRAAQLAELARADAVAPALVLEYSDAIVSVAKRVSKIVQGLRLISRNGEKDDFEEVSVRALVEETLVFCQERLKMSSIRSEVPEIAEDLRIQCRRVQVSQVLLNLVTNAFDAVEGGPAPWIRIEVAPTREGVAIRVGDSGPGVPEAARARLFEPFFTTKSGNKGTGLGLSISRAIAENHGGRLDISPAPGPTQFVLTLPYRQKSDIAPPSKL